MFTITSFPQLLPVSHRDELHQERQLKAAYGFVYKDNKPFYVVGKTSNDLLILKATNDADSFEADPMDYSIVPSDSDFETFKNNVSVFKCFDNDGNFNMDVKFHNMAAECIVSDGIQDLMDAFDKDDVFITNDTNMYVVYNTKRQDFFVISLNQDFYVDSLHLALRSNYEFNKSLPDA